MAANKNSLNTIIDEAWDAACENAEIGQRARGLVSNEELAQAAWSKLHDRWEGAVSGELDRWRVAHSALEKLKTDLGTSYRASFTASQRWWNHHDESKILAKVLLAVGADPRFRLALETERISRAALQKSLIERSFLPALRTELNQRFVDDIAQNNLHTGDARGLDQLLPEGFELQSFARSRVEALLSTLSTASIGIGGPRGSGKTTLLSWACKAPTESQSFRLLINAPAKYEARDYLTYLLSTLSRKVLAVHGEQWEEDEAIDRKSEAPSLRPYVLKSTALGLALVFAAVTAIAAGLWVASSFATATQTNTFIGFLIPVVIYASVTSAQRVVFEPLRLAVWLKRPQELSLFKRLVRASRATRVLLVATVLLLILLLSSQSSPDYRIVAASIIAVGVVATLYVFGRTSKRDGWDFRLRSYTELQNLYGSEARSVSPLANMARQKLQRVTLQQALSSTRAERFGVSNPLKIPIGFDSTTTAGRTASTIPWTRPELVGEIRLLLTSMAESRQVVIGIDELDKIQSAEEAVQFVDDIKSIFGIPGCFFLISISDDALADFERRGLPFRNAFDSAFDEVIALNYFSFAESRDLLRSRVVALPLRFIALCHALSGGLPRDLIRVARNVYEFALPVTLEQAAVQITSTELERKASLMASSMRTFRLHPWSELFAVWTDRAALYESETKHLLAVANELCSLVRDAASSRSELKEDEWKALRVCEEMATFVYYCATIREICDSSTQVHNEQHDTIVQLLGEMARARQAFAIHPALAWSRIDRLRLGAHWDALGSSHWT